MKILFKIIIFIIILVIFSWLFFYTKDFLFAPTFDIKSVCYKNNCFLVELAVTTAQQEKGLMFVNKMDKKNGMLFIFSKENIYPFWMKNTFIPLDIIWINKDKKVVYINENSQPCLLNLENCVMINPGASALYVLEINAGIVKEIGLKIGDYLNFSDK